MCLSFASKLELNVRHASLVLVIWSDISRHIVNMCYFKVLMNCVQQVRANRLFSCQPSIFKFDWQVREDELVGFDSGEDVRVCS